MAAVNKTTAASRAVKVVIVGDGTVGKVLLLVLFFVWQLSLLFLTYDFLIVIVLYFKLVFVYIHIDMSSHLIHSKL
jgi:hypothetical protein